MIESLLYGLSGCTQGGRPRMPPGDPPRKGVWLADPELESRFLFVLKTYS